MDLDRIRHRRPTVIAGAALLASLILLPNAAASASAADTADWKAVLRVGSLNYTGIDTVFSAIGTHGRDTRGLTFQYDFDGDGIYDLSTTDGAASHIFEKPGTYTAHLLVTDEYLLTASASATFTIVGIENIGPPLSPDERAPTLKGAQLSSSHAAPGGQVFLTIVGPNKSDRVAARLVADTSDSPWDQDAVEAYGPLDASVVSAIRIGSDVKPGRYQMVIVTESGQMASKEFTIDRPNAMSRVTEYAPWIAGGVFLVGSGLVLAVRRRRTKRDSTVVGR